MPELPEAEVVSRQLRDKLLGATLIGIWIGRADIVREGYSTRDWYHQAQLQSVHRYGKSVALGFEKGKQVRYLVAELGMTGLLLFPSAITKYPQHVHVRMVFAASTDIEVRYWNPRRFGRISLLNQNGLDQYVERRFGCDPLSVELPEFIRMIKVRRGRLKPLLMHQQVIAGIGNIYANEILFRARLHPNTHASRLSRAKIERLYHVMREVLQQAIICGGSSVKDFLAPDGTTGKYAQHHLVYGKEGEPCPNQCGRVIRRLQSERSSFYCPTCQRLR